MNPSSNAFVANLLLARASPEERSSTIATVVEQLKADADANRFDGAVVGLAADLLHLHPDTSLETTLSETFLAAIVRNQDDAATLQSLAGICVAHDALAHRVLNDIERYLVRLAGLTCVPQSPWYVIDSLSSVQKYGLSSDLPETPQDSPAQIQSAIENSASYISFVKHFLRSLEESDFSISSRLLNLLLLNLASSSESLSLAAFDALSTVLSCLRPSQIPFSDGDAFPSQLWDRISKMASLQPDATQYKSTFRLWLHWVNAGDRRHPTQAILKQDAYWSFLRQGLLNGLSEQRKYCLHILHMSIQLVQEDVRTETMQLDVSQRSLYEEQYTKYCTVFDTVVLGRYLNQVEECRGDMGSLAPPSSKVHHSWFLTLLSAALMPGIQDSIRKVVGTWTLDHFDLSQIPYTARKDFLCGYFLPWVSQGFLFTAGLRRSRGRVTCEHGESLSRFLQRLLHNLPSQEGKRTATRDILEYIRQQGGNLFPDAAAYMLEGLVKGLGSDRCLEAAEVERAVAVSARTGLPDAVRDLCITYCTQLTELSTVPEASIEGIHGYKQLRRAFDRVQSPTSLLADTSVERSECSDATETTKPLHISLESLVNALHESKHQCLRGDGLTKACIDLRQVLDRSSVDSIAPEALYTMLDAIWEEVEIQDYPKDALMLLPGIFFHPLCIPLCAKDTSTSSDPQLAAKLNAVMLSLQKMSESRIFIWSPLAQAIREAYFAVPQTASVLPLDEFVIRMASKPPSAKLEFLFEAVMAGKLEEIVPHRCYETYYGRRESYGHACILDVINRFRREDAACGRRIMDELLAPWTAQTPPVPIASKWKSTLQLQMMLMLLELVIADAPEKQVTAYIDAFFHVLAIEPMPRYRYVLEWILARIFLQRPDRRGLVLDLLATRDHSNPKHIASVMKIAVMVARLPDTTEAFALRLMTLLIPLAASPKIVIRHEAHWSFPILWAEAEQRRPGAGWPALLDNPGFAALTDHIRHLDRYLAPPAARLLEWLDPVRDHHLAHLFQGGYLRIEPREPPLLTTEDFRHLPAIASPSAPALPLGTASPSPHSDDEDTAFSPPTPPSPPPPTSTIPLQTKGLPWKQPSPLSAPSPNPSPSSSPPSLHLIGTLLTNPTNLGGLSRLAECFRVSTLLLPSLTLLSDRSFTALSVSSHRHLPIRALAPEALPAWLRDVKRQGYAVWGVEQTDRSVMLGERGTCLPRRLVLVMGSEREGIPANVLAECDGCVEVRQWGRTRSLNVQTAAAIALFEWRRQHGG